MSKKRKKELITPAAYARLIGLNKSTIYRQIADGKITVKNGLLNPKEADAERQANVSVKTPAMHRHAPGRAPVPIPGQDSKLELERRLAFERAEKLRLQNEVTKGNLVDAAEVAAATEEVFRRESAALLTWPSRVSGELAAELNVSERLLAPVLDRYIRQYMTERSRVPVPQLPEPSARPILVPNEKENEREEDRIN